MKLNLKVKGMHCDSCATLIKEDLLDIGVKKVDVSLKKELVLIEFDEKKLTLHKIKEAIEALNYDVTTNYEVN